MVRLDDFDVVAGVENPRRHFKQAEHGIDAHRHVRREHHRNVLASLGNDALAVGGKTGGADDHGRTQLARQRQVLQRAFGAREIDDAIGGGDRRTCVIHDGHATRRTEKLTRVTSDEGGIGMIEGGHQRGLRVIERGLDQHPAHASGRAGDGDAALRHA